MSSKISMDLCLDWQPFWLIRLTSEGLKTLVPMEQHTDEDGEPLRGIPLLNNVLTAWES